MANVLTTRNEAFAGVGALLRSSIGQANTAWYSVPRSRGNRGRNRRPSAVTSYVPSIGGWLPVAAVTTCTLKIVAQRESRGPSLRSGATISGGNPLTSNRASGAGFGTRAMAAVGGRSPAAAIAPAQLRRSAAVSHRRQRSFRFTTCPKTPRIDGTTRKTSQRDSAQLRAVARLVFNLCGVS